MLSKFYKTVRHHNVITILVGVFLFGLPVGITFASDVINTSGGAGEVVSNMLKSLDFYTGFAIGSPAGYGFALRTTVQSLKDRIKRDEAKLSEYDNLLNSALREKLEKS